MSLRAIPISALLLTASLAGPALPGQDDLRDKVTRTDGKAVIGRVLVPTATEEVVVMQAPTRDIVPPLVNNETRSA